MAKATASAPMFESVLDMPGEMIERPKPLPRGTYLTILVGQPRIDKSSQKQTEFVEFTHKILQADEDVDPAELDKFLTSADGTKKSLSDSTIRNTFYLTPNSAFMFKDFCSKLDIDTSKGNPRQWLAETTGRQCIVHIKWRPWDSGEGVSAQIDKIMKAE